MKEEDAMTPYGHDALIGRDSEPRLQELVLEMVGDTIHDNWLETVEISVTVGLEPVSPLEYLAAVSAWN